VYAGIQGGPRLGDAEAGAAAALGGTRFAAWSGGLLSIAAAALTSWLLPQLWRYEPGSAAAIPSGQPPADPAGPALPLTVGPSC